MDSQPFSLVAIHCIGTEPVDKMQQVKIMVCKAQYSAYISTHDIIIYVLQ